MEKRRFERFAADDLVISWTLPFPGGMCVLDISLGGIAVNAKKGMSPGKKCMLKIKINGTSVLQKVTVAWCTLMGSKKESNGDVAPVYSIGFHLNNSSPEMQAIIEPFSAAHKDLAYRAESYRNTIPLD
jgi:hypothetical protein